MEARTNYAYSYAYGDGRETCVEERQALGWRVGGGWLRAYTF